SPTALHSISSLLPRPPRPPRFPYTTLFRSPAQRPRNPHAVEEILSRTTRWGLGWGSGRGAPGIGGPLVAAVLFRCGHGAYSFAIDRKSTRLNSSHVSISYAVFCLKKTNNKR